MEENKKSSLAVPLAIIIGFALVAGAIYFSGQSSTPSGINMPTGNSDQAPVENPSVEAINPVTEADHIRGNPNAQIILVEYSDYDCPFCKNFHETMNQVMDTYGPDGRVAWVYRHFPLEQLHPNAHLIAQASECVAKLGGNDAFWSFSDLVFEEREINAQTDPNNLPNFAEIAGVNVNDYQKCVDDGETKDAVEEDLNNALAIGGRGTPHTIVLVGDQQGVINGAQSFETVSSIIDNLITQLDGASVE
jgi:protein-disulfide isomerase